MKKAICSILLMAGAMLPWGVAQAAVPSAGATLSDHRAAVDGNGVVFAEGNEDIGWKVFSATAGTTTPLVDEAGNKPTSGVIGRVCVSTGASTNDFGIIYDSAPAAGDGSVSLGLANQNANLQWQMAPEFMRSTTLVNCQQINAQFNLNVWLLNYSAADTNATMTVYWRPSKGGRN